MTSVAPNTPAVDSTGSWDRPLRVAVALAPEGRRAFNSILQRGVHVFARTECSVGDFLRDQIGLEPEYVKDRLATVLLDGKVVDDLEQTTLHADSTLTLSAAMPGLVGATLRKGGFYAAMRSQISWTADGDTTSAARPSPDRPAIVRIKLFNLILAEVGPRLLARGVVLSYEDAVAVLEGWWPGTADLPVGRPVFLEATPPTAGTP